MSGFQIFHKKGTSGKNKTLQRYQFICNAFLYKLLGKLNLQNVNTFYQMWGDGEGGGYLCASGGVRSSASRTLIGEENVVLLSFSSGRRSDSFFVFGMQMVPNISSFIKIVFDFLEETDILVGTGSCDNQASGIVRTTDVIVEL